MQPEHPNGKGWGRRSIPADSPRLYGIEGPALSGFQGAGFGYRVHTRNTSGGSPKAGRQPAADSSRDLPAGGESLETS